MRLGPSRSPYPPITVTWLRRLPSAAMATERTAPFSKLSVFFPMWNEEAYIDRAIEAATTECLALMAKNEILDYELIIVDDASTDHTGKLADEMAPAGPPVGVVRPPVTGNWGG